MTKSNQANQRRHHDIYRSKKTSKKISSWLKIQIFEIFSTLNIFVLPFESFKILIIFQNRLTINYQNRKIFFFLSPFIKVFFLKVDNTLNKLVFTQNNVISMKPIKFSASFK